MNGQQALKLIRERLEDIQRFQQIGVGKQDFELWKYRIRDIIKAAFGESSDEYERVSDKEIGRKLPPITQYVGQHGTVSNVEKRRVLELQAYETGLRSIIQELEMLGSNRKQPVNGERPKAFIAHGGESGALSKLKDFLTALGVEPIIVEEQPSEGKSLDDKVEHYLALADCAIILGSAGDRIGEKWLPRQNVVHEIGLAQKTFPDKIVYLLEQNAEFPSNVRPKVWQSFARDCMDEAFVAIAREFTAFGIIQAVKPSD